MRHDFCVIGGGIVGLATAYALLNRFNGASLILIEKENDLAQHQTGHNSGVIHAGVYYAPGSLKAEFCRAGNAETKAFCDEWNIPYKVCGKLIVATNAAELARLGDLEARTRENGIEARFLSESELRSEEPNVSGKAALLVPSTGIVDYRRVCSALARAVRNLGGDILVGARVDAIQEGGEDVEIISPKGRWMARRLVACAGLQSDRLARAAGLKTDFRIVPFRGEYFMLPPGKSDLVRHLIYPVPDPSLPFLGIHLTRTMDGRVTVGPNAVLGRGRESYDKWHLSPGDLLDTASFAGFWRLAANHWRSGIREMFQSALKSAYLKECRKYAPGLALSDLEPYPAGIRAQAVRNNGSMVHDFVMLSSDRMLHVCNAPSPAATSAFPIGRHIAHRIPSP